MTSPVLRSMLFVPGDQPRMVAKAPTLDADAVILDLEDGVASKDKPAARDGIREALHGGFGVRGTLWVRPNGLATGLLEDDLLSCVWQGVAGVVVPKVRSAHDVRLADGVAQRVARSRGMGELMLAVLIETPPAVLDVAEIVRASRHVAALVFGADDLAAEMGLIRTPGNMEVAVPRAQVALAAHAAGCEAVDIAYTQVRDLDGLTRECREGRALGYTGKQVIHPTQIAPANAAFSPAEDEVAWARRVIEAYRQAPRGALVVDGRMVDAPIVVQAERVLERAAKVTRLREG